MALGGVTNAARKLLDAILYVPRKASDFIRTSVKGVARYAVYGAVMLFIWNFLQNL